MRLLLIAGVALSLLACETTGDPASATGTTGTSGPTGIAGTDDAVLGELAADFTLPDLNENSPTFGQDVTLSDLRGHVVVVYFALAT